MRSTRDFFVGVVTGVTIGLLSAPRTGRESRQWLKSEYDKRTQSSGSSGGPSLQERFMAIVDQVKAEVNKYTQQKQNHEARMADTGRFDYQREREQRLYGPNTDQPATTQSTGAYKEHNAQIIQN